MSDKNMEYNPNLAALAVNFIEIIGEMEIEDKLVSKMLMKALEKSGYGGVTHDEVERNLGYYLTEATDVDIYSLPEYQMKMPPIYNKELY
jgi:hypothetical protein